MTGDEIACLRAKVRKWEVEANVAPVHMRPMYLRMAAACVRMAHEGAIAPVEAAI
jgi:hypothetical protein